MLNFLESLLNYAVKVKIYITKNYNGLLKTF